MIATGLSAPTQSSVGIAAATVSPMISYEIGQKFKELAKDNPDGKLTEKQQAAHVLAHAVLGAAVAAAGGNDALAGGASAGGAEYLAPKVSTFLYGTADPEKLTAEQKDTVANIMSLAGASVGVAVGNTSTNAVSGSLNAESAVENNFSLPRNTRYISADAAQLIKKIEQSAAKILAAEDMKYIYLETYQDKIREIIANNHSEQEKQREFEQLWEKNKYVSQVLENIIKSFSVGDKDRHTFYFELVPKMDNLLLSSYYDLKLTGGKPNLLDKERTDWLPELPKTIDGKGSSIQRIHCTWTKDPDCLGILDAQGGKIAGNKVVITPNNTSKYSLSSEKYTSKTIYPNDSSILYRGRNNGYSNPYAKDVLYGGNGKAISGHGIYEQYKIYPKSFTVPQGTTVISAPHGTKITDTTGLFLESVGNKQLEQLLRLSPERRMNIVNSWVRNHKKTLSLTDNQILNLKQQIKELKIYSSGEQMYNYTILPPVNLRIYKNSITVEEKKNLNEMVSPNQGCVPLATCTEIKRR